MLRKMDSGLEPSLVRKVVHQGKNPSGHPNTSWPHRSMTHGEALTALQALNAELLSHDSATLTLERWCGLHRADPQPRIVAERLHELKKAPTEQLRRELQVTGTEPIRYRRVMLRYGTTVLSEADNWYVPARLTPEMNVVLDTTDTPFGRAVQALHFRRQTTLVKFLWPSLADGLEIPESLPTSCSAQWAEPAHVLEHQAVLTLQEGTPFSVVVETYAGRVLSLGIQGGRQKRPFS